MRSFWLVVAALVCLGGTDALAQKKVDWSEYLEPKGGSKTQLVRTSEPAPKAAKASKVKKKKAVAKKAKAKKSKRHARRR
jgi:hypothetical protein